MAVSRSSHPIANLLLPSHAPRSSEPHTNGLQKRRIEDEGNDVDASTFKPCARFLPTGGREYTVSIAVPGSIITE